MTNKLFLWIYQRSQICSTCWFNKSANNIYLISVIKRSFLWRFRTMFTAHLRSGLGFKGLVLAVLQKVRILTNLPITWGCLQSLFSFPLGCKLFRSLLLDFYWFCLRYNICFNAHGYWKRDGIRWLQIHCFWTSHNVCIHHQVGRVKWRLWSCVLVLCS